MFRTHSMLSGSRSRLLFVAATLLLAVARPAVALDIDKQFTFEIPPQKLATALLQFSHQAGVQVVVGPEVGEQTTAGITGTQSIGNALSRLLHSSGLTYAPVGEISIAVGKPQPVNPTTRTYSPELGALRLALVAQGDAENPGTGTGAAEEKEKESSSEETDKPKSKGMPEILIKGSLSSNTDIRRTEDDIQPYVTFDREQIERSQAPDLEAFFKSRLPMDTRSFCGGQASNGSEAAGGAADPGGLEPITHYS